MTRLAMFATKSDVAENMARIPRCARLLGSPKAGHASKRHQRFRVAARAPCRRMRLRPLRLALPEPKRQTSIHIDPRAATPRPLRAKLEMEHPVRTLLGPSVAAAEESSQRSGSGKYRNCPESSMKSQVPSIGSSMFQLTTVPKAYVSVSCVRSTAHIFLRPDTVPRLHSDHIDH